MSQAKEILFLTATRADFGKLKALIQSVDHSEQLNCKIFVTGMHMLQKYGLTVNEIYKAGFSNIFTYQNQVENDGMDIALANTIQGLSSYITENKVDLIVVHGDRVEALAGSIVGALNNILVAHVEGGEISGTVDELIRHSVSKLSHIHYVANETAQKRLLQLGELENTIFNIGSPDIDVMLSGDLPSLDEAKEWYDIEFSTYSIAMLHPVTTDPVETQMQHAQIFVKSLLKTDNNYIVIFPNNDHGSKYIFDEYKKLENKANFKLFPSLRFEYFLTLLQNAQSIIGNSSAGMHEAPVYGVPTINIGSRQSNRYKGPSIKSVPFDQLQIIDAIQNFSAEKFDPSYHYGKGNSAESFLKTLHEKCLWDINVQKQFKDLLNNNV